MNARVCLYDLHVSREIFAVFQTKHTLIYIHVLHLFDWPLLAFLTSENDVICTVALHHLSQIWLVIVHYNI